MILSTAIVNDYGMLVYRCLYTGRWTQADEAKLVGSIAGNFIGSFVMHKESTKEKKESDTAFYESEQNCNTCIHLKRVKHSKDHGFLQGECMNEHTQKNLIPYVADIETNVKFHPQDPMHMPCYVSRFTV